MKKPHLRNLEKKISNLGFLKIRPIVRQAILRETKLVEYFDFEVFGDLKNADYLHENGLVPLVTIQ